MINYSKTCIKTPYKPKISQDLAKSKNSHKILTRKIRILSKYQHCSIAILYNCIFLHATAILKFDISREFLQKSAFLSNPNKKNRILSELNQLRKSVSRPIIKSNDLQCVSQKSRTSQFWKIGLWLIIIWPWCYLYWYILDPGEKVHRYW